MILVFGKSGQVATELRRKGDVIALGRDEVDLARPGAAEAAIREMRPGVIINAAAYTAVDRAEAEEPLAHRINAEAPGEMARAAAETGARFLHVSTDYVFDGSGSRPWQPDDKPAPLGAYGRTKLAGERAVAEAAGQYVIMRTSWVFSAHGSNFVKTMLRLGQERGQLRVVADQIGGPTPAADIAAALLHIAATGGPSGIYHFGGVPAVSWADFARRIFAMAGVEAHVEDIPTSAYPTPARRPLNSRLASDDLTRDYGIAAPDWTRGLADVLKELGY